MPLNRIMTDEGVDITVVIVSHNTCELTCACVESVYAQSRNPQRMQVVLIDNKSDDGSAAALASRFPQLTLIASNENLGFAGANNLAFEHAKGEYFLLLNPDTVVLDYAIDKLLDFAKAHPEAHIFGGRTYFGDGTLNPASCWRKPSLWSVLCIACGLTALFPRSPLFNREAYGDWRRDSVQDVDIVSGCFLLMRQSLWRELGGFDPAFFMYGEEADLCWRALKLGKRCLINPDAQIIHYGGASEKVRADKMVRLFSAKAKLFKRHWRTVSASLGIFALDLWAASRLMAFSVLSRISNGREDSYRTWLNIWQRRKEWHVDF